MRNSNINWPYIHQLLVPCVHLSKLYEVVCETLLLLLALLLFLPPPLPPFLPPRPPLPLPLPDHHLSSFHLLDDVDLTSN